MQMLLHCVFTCPEFLSPAFSDKLAVLSKLLADARVAAKLVRVAEGVTVVALLGAYAELPAVGAAGLRDDIPSQRV